MRMDLINTLGAFASASTILCQLVGIQICLQIVRKGGTDLISAVPFVTFFVSACLWTKYGFLQNNTNLVLTNAAGAILQFIYMIVYYIYTSKKSHFHCLLMIGIITLLTPLLLISYIQNDSEKDSRLLGFICCTLSVCCYISPMATLRDICVTKNSESMSFWLVMFNFISAMCWMLYGVFIRDRYIVMPNSFGVLFGLMQFVLFCIYPSVRHKQRTVNPVLLQQV